MIARSYPDVVSSLSYSGRYMGEQGQRFASPFMTLLSNQCRGFPLADTSLTTRQMVETLAGYKLVLPASSIESTSSGQQVQIEFDETSDARVLVTIKAWCDYIQEVRRGKMLPSPWSLSTNTIDYLSSIYFFNIGPDGDTIQTWGRYTGVAPLSVPYSAYSAALGDNGSVKPTVPFIYNHKEEMSPTIFRDFNLVARGDFASLTNLNGGLNGMMSFRNDMGGWDEWRRLLGAVTQRGLAHNRDPLGFYPAVRVRYEARNGEPTDQSTLDPSALVDGRYFLEFHNNVGQLA